jgi:hypothetical protein
MKDTVIAAVVQAGSKVLDTLRTLKKLIGATTEVAARVGPLGGRRHV